MSVEASVHVSEKAARRAVTMWLVSDVGNMLMAGHAQIIISERTVWRFPILMTSSERGIVGEVGSVEVDAATIELLIDEEQKEHVVMNAQQFASSALSPVS